MHFEVTFSGEIPDGRPKLPGHIVATFRPSVVRLKVKDAAP